VFSVPRKQLVATHAAIDVVRQALSKISVNVIAAKLTMTNDRFYIKVEVTTDTAHSNDDIEKMLLPLKDLVRLDSAYTNKMAQQVLEQQVKSKDIATSVDLVLAAAKNHVQGQVSFLDLARAAASAVKEMQTPAPYSRR
jgi:hypothetical protein